MAYFNVFKERDVKPNITTPWQWDILLICNHYLNGSSNRIVAALWNTIFTSFSNIVWSLSDIPKPSRDISPWTATILSVKFGFVFLMVLKSWNRKHKDFNIYIKECILHNLCLYTATRFSNTFVHVVPLILLEIKYANKYS